MGLTLDPDTLIGPFRPALIKQALAHLERHGNRDRLASLKSLFLAPEDAQSLYALCVSRGLVDPRTCRPTAQGEAFARGRLTRRTARADAERILGILLARCSAYNAESVAFEFVDEVWLFGSMLSAEPTVGDIDLAIRISHRQPGHNIDRRAAVFEAVMRHPNCPKRHLRSWEAPRWLTERAMFGPRRHRLLASVQMNLTDLIAIAAPCRLIFDRARGGRVAGPVLASHPEADSDLLPRNRSDDPGLLSMPQ